MSAKQVARIEEDSGGRKVTEVIFDCPAQAEDVVTAIKVSDAWQRALVEKVRG